MSSANAPNVVGTRRDHHYHRLRVGRVIAETDDASSFAFDVPRALADTFAYRAGQFCTFRVTVEGTDHIRCYSMSSAPDVDDALQVTVKRVPDGVVSNWMVDSLSAGDEIEVAPPAGFFQLTDDGGDVVAFAAGSGITPVFSLLKSLLATTTRRAWLLYANRDAGSVIFDAELAALATAHPDRLALTHHFDADAGFVAATDVIDLLGCSENATCYVCGPTPFMNVVESALLERGVDAERIHIERFTAAEAVPPPNAVEATEASQVTDDDITISTIGTTVTIELDGQVVSTEHRAGTTILQTARQAGLSPPFSCESGSCATCMGRLVEGCATMRTNNALTPDEVDDGWILTCQAVPTTPSVHVVYGYE